MLRRIVPVTTLVIGLAAHAWAGLTFTSVTKMEGAKTPAAQPQVVSKVTMDGDKLRMETTGEGMSHGPFRGYFLTQDGGKTMYMVNPDDKSYMTWDMDKLMSGGMAQMTKGLMNLKFTNVKVEKLAEDKGEAILGYPTTHYRFRTSYQTEMSMFGHTSTSSVVQDEDVWATPKITAPAMQVWARKQMPSTGDQGLDKLVREQHAKMVGLPLRRTSTTTHTDQSGRQQVTKTSTEVTDVKESAIDAATFEIPSDYQAVQMPQMPMAPAP